MEVEMPKFERKPPTVIAERWDGTDVGAESLSKFFQEEFPNLRVEVVLTMNFVDGVGYGRIAFMSNILGLKDATMRDGDWILSLEDGSFDVMGDERFKERYSEVDDD